MSPPAQLSFEQRSLDQLGAPLLQTTFVVIDLETTGGSAANDMITEVGAIKMCGGESLGTFQTFVNPGCAIPPQIVVLTGITQSMVVRAPRVEAVLPSLLEFIGDAVIVGHNVRFDMSFLQIALARTERPRLTNRVVDTVTLARRLLRDEVPNCKLGTLAERLRLDHQPSHRALDDALATADLLHVLIERAAGFGVTGLDDLLALPTIAGSEHAAKLRLTDRLPRAPGVYVFRDPHGRPLYVGKASNLRSRVRSYFSTDTRRKIGSLLREVGRIDHTVCHGTLDAAVMELRLIQELRPRYNAQGKGQGTAYLKLTTDRFPRLSVVRDVRPDGAFYLGPLPSSRVAQLVVEAVQTAVPLRRCSERIGKVPHRAAACTPAQLGVAECPCSGTIDAAAYALLVERVVVGLTDRPDLLLTPLADRMAALATAERFEEAADVRDRADALATALRRHRRLDALRHSGTLVLDAPGETRVELRGGRLRRVAPRRHGSEPFSTPLFDEHDDALAADAPLPRHLADELACVAAWLDANAHRVRIVYGDTPLSEPYPPLPSFAPPR
jgi:DNA polymerase-3 subunit epsilon